MLTIPPSLGIMHMMNLDSVKVVLWRRSKSAVELKSIRVPPLFQWMIFRRKETLATC